MTMRQRKKSLKAPAVLFVLSESVKRFLQIVGMSAFALLLSIQYARMLERNIVVSHEVGQEEEQIHRLQLQRDHEQRIIARLERPDGAIPEIHDRLHLVRTHEEIVYLRHSGDGANAVSAP